MQGRKYPKDIPLLEQDYQERAKYLQPKSPTDKSKLLIVSDHLNTGNTILRYAEVFKKYGLTFDVAVATATTNMKKLADLQAQLPAGTKLYIGKHQDRLPFYAGQDSFNSVTSHNANGHGDNDKLAHIERVNNLEPGRMVRNEIAIFTRELAKRHRSRRVRKQQRRQTWKKVA
jgi:hypothetical protein